jgi:hypothetical protein
VVFADSVLPLEFGGRTKTRLLKGVTSECKHAANFRGNGLTRPPPTIPESD